jgi:hypothetical protein
LASVKMSPTRRKKIRTLARTMNKQNIRLIPLTSGIIDFMSVTLTDPELDYLLQLGTQSYPFREAAALSRLPEPEFREFLEGLLQKGFLQCQEKDGVEHYLLFPVVVGWFEFQIFYGMKTQKQQEFARMAEEVLRPVKKFNVPGLRGLINLGGRLAQKSYQRIDPVPSPDLSHQDRERPDRGIREQERDRHRALHLPRVAEGRERALPVQPPL